MTYSTLVLLAIAWLLGIAAASFTGAEAFASLAAAGLLGVVSFAVRPRWTTLALIGAGSVLIFAATWRYESTTPEHSPIARFNEAIPFVSARSSATNPMTGALPACTAWMYRSPTRKGAGGPTRAVC